LKIVTWNVAHQVRDTPLHPRLIDAVRALDADVLVLNEYVHRTPDPSRASFLSALLAMGYRDPIISSQILRNPGAVGEKPKLNNQVLIAAKVEVEQGSLRGPAMVESGGETNFLHVRLAGGLEIVGMRVPSYDGANLSAYWKKFLEILQSSQDRSILYVGDMNANPDEPGRGGGAKLAALRAAGWQVPRPSGEWSFEAGTSIDHAIASSRFPAISARYVSEVAGLTLARRNSPKRHPNSAIDAEGTISDHAALVVEFAS
jgi:endonuclease/exonuclease/phosphatase family metal-dependent hydrolase